MVKELLIGRYVLGVMAATVVLSLWHLLKTFLREGAVFGIGNPYSMPVGDSIAVFLITVVLLFLTGLVFWLAVYVVSYTVKRMSVKDIVIIGAVLGVILDLVISASAYDHRPSIVGVIISAVPYAIAAFFFAKVAFKDIQLEAA